MPKRKKEVNKNDPDAIKEAGNKAFMAKNFDEAIKCYTIAIEITLEKPNHVFYANRANAQLELHNYEECINDCNSAIEIEPTYTKSYYRKAKALYCQNRLQDALSVIEKAHEMEPSNSDILSLQDKIIKEIELESKLPPDHPERVKFQAMLDWMKEGGADYSKLKLVYYTENNRGVHAQ